MLETPLDSTANGFMQAPGSEIDHQRVREELKELSAIEIAGLMLSMQRGDGSRFGQKIDAADLPPMHKYDSAEALFKDVEQLQTRGEPYPRIFELTGKGSQDQYVRSTLQDLEYMLHLGEGKKLSYTWFCDDKGNAQVFLIDDKKQGSMAASVKHDREPSTGCIEFGSIADKNLNRLERLPADTPADEAFAIHSQRARAAALVLQNIDPSLNDADVTAINAERDSAKGQLFAQRNSADEEDIYSQYALQARAIDMGLPPFTSEAIVNSTQAALQKQANAIKLGLSRYATDEEMNNANNEINNFVDSGRNFADNYPQGTTFSEMLKISEPRLRQSQLIGENIDPTRSREEIADIRSAREKRLMDLMQAQNGATNSAEVDMLRYQMSAVKLGLPEDINPIVLQQTQDKLSRQAIAALHGLDINATQEEIDAAEKKSSEYELQSMPQNVCSVK